MATKLEKPITREIVMRDAYGKTGVVSVRFTMRGIEFFRGRRKLNVVLWEDIGQIAQSHAIGNQDIPAKYMQNVFGWLIELENKKKKF